MEKGHKKEIFTAIVTIAVVFIGFTPTIDNWFASLGLCLKSDVRCLSFWTIVYLLAILIVVAISAYFLIIRPNVKKKDLLDPSPTADMRAEIERGDYQGVSGNHAHVTYDNSKHFHFGKDETKQTNSENKIAPPEIIIEAPFTIMPAFAVVKFRVENKSPKKVIACHAKLNVTQVSINENGILLRPYPESLYPNKVLWAGSSIDGIVDLRPNAPEYLSVLELGQEYFRFLFHGDKTLPAGTRESIYLSDTQTEWLSHSYHTIELILFGDDANGEPIQIENKFALSFSVAKDKKPSCKMIIRKIESYEDVPENRDLYFVDLDHLSSDRIEPPAIVKKFISNLNRTVNKKTFSSPAMAFLDKVRATPPFLGISHAEPVLLPEHEKELTEYFQAVEFMTKNKDLIKGGYSYQCKDKETEKDIAQKEYGNVKFASQILNANPGGFPFSTGQMINLPRIDISEKLGVSTAQLDVLYALSQGQRVRKTLDFLLNGLHLQYDEALPLLDSVYEAAQKALKTKVH